MPLWTLSQTTDISPEQQKKIDSILTVEKIIDLSKCVSNEKVLEKKVIELQYKLDMAYNIIQSYENNYNDLIEETNQIRQSLSDIDKKLIEQNKKRVDEIKKWYSGFHFDAYIYTQNIQLEQVNAGGKLYYKFKNGFRLTPAIDIRSFNIDDKNRKAAISIELSYNIFGK